MQKYFLQLEITRSVVSSVEKYIATISGFWIDPSENGRCSRGIQC